MNPHAKPITILDPPMRAWIQSLPCCIAEQQGIPQTSVTDCTHVHTKRNAGDEGNMVPMAHDTHMELHRIGRHSFEARYGVDLERLATEYQRMWNGMAFDA